MKQVVIFGVTGSIGTQTLEVLKLFPEEFVCAGVSASGKKKSELETICREFSPQYIHIFDEKVCAEMETQFPDATFFSGAEGLKELANTSADLFVNSLPGEMGVIPSREVIHNGKTLLLANKESLVCEGIQIMEKCNETGAKIIPLDSEASAIWQATQGRDMKDVKKIYLTCSGGPFRDAEKWPLTKLQNVTKEEALAHPTWKMGPKISIDSATLMNKAFEMIEITRLFQVDPEIIEVVIHPESLIHSAVQFTDGQILAHMGSADMKPIIAYGLFEGKKRMPLPFQEFSFFDHTLTFKKPDESRFPSLRYAREALQKGESACAELCRKNDANVEKFLNGEIGFLEIFV